MRLRSYVNWWLSYWYPQRTVYSSDNITQFIDTGQHIKSYHISSPRNITTLTIIPHDYDASVQLHGEVRHQLYNETCLYRQPNRILICLLELI